MKITKNDLEIISAEGEGQRIEFKESFTTAIVKDIVAFANSLGGRTFIGVDDEGKIKGICITNKLKSQITDLARNCDPPIIVKLQVLDNVIIVNVEEGTNKPYQCREGFFLRQGPNSQKLTRDQILQFCIDETKIRFDTQLNQKFIYPKDFDKRLWKKYLDAIQVSTKYKTEDILINLGVAQRKAGKFLFNNTGVLFFAKEPCNFFQSAYIDAVVFKGTERIDVIDRKIFRSGLLENLDNTRIFLQEHLNVRYKYREDWKRENVYELPMEALREAVANALMHRDYFITGANITVSIFDDRVTISNPGGLPKPLTLKDLGKISKRRNETIADLFARLDFVEKLATGINKMRYWMKEYGLEIPKIETNGFFTIKFNRPTTKIKEEMSVKNVGKMSVNNVGKQERKKMILKKIKIKEPFTLITLAKEFGVSEKTTERDINELKDDGIIRFVGSKRTGRYEIIFGIKYQQDV
jgi:ATP-dependent DNA helicase RecG